MIHGISNKEKVLPARNLGLEENQEISKVHRFAYQEGTIH